MKLDVYIDTILDNPTEESLLKAGKALKKLRSQTAGKIGYELKIFSKEVNSMASFASPKAGIMQWSSKKITEYLRTKKKNLSNRTLSLEVSDD